MSTAPSEAHIDLAVTIYKKRESFPPFDKVKEAAQLIADSEARAVEAANTEIAELKKCIEELYQQAHETVQFSDSNEMSMDMEISAAFGILASHRDEAQAALTADRERVREMEAVTQWVPVSERLPKTGQRVLVTALNGIHVWRTVAQYWPAGTMDASDWDDPPDDWWDEDGNKCTNPEAGWYESQVESEVNYLLSGVSHWMPLPDVATTKGASL